VNEPPALVWLDRDLRLADNPALDRAIARGSAVIPVFIWAPEEEAPWSPGAASRWWLHQSLHSLQADLERRGSRLIVRRGPAVQALLALAAESGARAIFWNRRYEPAVIARDQELERRAGSCGIATESCPGNVLFEPGTILNMDEKPFRVFTAFWRACLAQPDPAEPTRSPARLPGLALWPSSMGIGELGLEPPIDWVGGMRETWRPGEAEAGARLKIFSANAIEFYPVDRDRPDHGGTSRLSPHLHFGEISARQIWHALRRGLPNQTAEPYLRQIGWREFSYHLLFHFPHTQQEPLRPEFRRFPWRVDAKSLHAWTQGKTGYPLVDAGMRELWHTGWMHNRVRMVVASFLVKHLMIGWQEGAAWFWDTLVDADLANNTMGWQWSAGCGADAAPYFRIFNPKIQAQKFDPNGDYVRRWIPRLDQNYPPPIVEHAVARARALAALATLRSGAGNSARGRLLAGH
jgi:deoxyribodipyrimidine photo-lyase